MPTNTVPDGAVIEIIEHVPAGETPSPHVIVPNVVRINGQSLLASRDHPVVVHEITTNPDSAVYVTLTLFARRVTIGTEVDA